MLLIFLGSAISNKHILIVKDPIPDKMIEKVGELAPFMLEYDGVQILPFFNIVFPKYIRYEDIPHSSYSTEFREEDFQRIISDYSKFEYVRTQSDPREVEERGANCQAVSLILHKSFTESGFENGFVLDKGLEHVYNWVIVEGDKYHVDLVKKSIIKVS